MSFNRENITWESADGTWNLAFFQTLWVGREADGFDPEWDVQYDYSEFDVYVYATKQATPDAAYEHILRYTSNPGGTNLVSRVMNTEACEKYDAMLAAAIGKAILKEQDKIRLERWSVIR